ncbi:LOW QUALITY PROTEIN: alcohol dehydrogenase [Geomicrobium sp. JCM 19037]|nr:LOW QUALITY PROTEIN: alcohol dehydrogenase [Geomicrobium sp. JCM 19037]
MHTMQFPKELVYGQDSLQQVGLLSKKLGNRALIISDEVMRELGVVAEVSELLYDQNIDSVVYLGIAGEPKDTYVTDALQLIRQQQCDHIVAVGGGSCIDTAKAAAVVHTNGGQIRDYMNQAKMAIEPGIPLIAVPTTGGTGSEVTDATVITDVSDEMKMMIKQPAFMPEVAIVDPRLTLTTPREITAAVGIDSVTHALEAYLSKDAHPFTDQLAVNALSLLLDNLRDVYHHGDRYEARHQVMYAAMLAGMAFSNASLCLVHGMSRPIGAKFHVPHGISNAMLLPVVLEYTVPACEQRLYELACKVRPERESYPKQTGAKALVEDLLRLCQDLNIGNFQSYGITEEDYMKSREKMAEEALLSGSPGNNPRVPDKKEIVTLYERAYAYQYFALDEINR